MSKCKRCGRRIVWVKTPAGKSMPCDPEPIHFIPAAGGDLQLVTANGVVARGRKPEENEKEISQIGYTSHFATCPYADTFRKRR